MFDSVIVTYIDLFLCSVQSDIHLFKGIIHPYFKGIICVIILYLLNFLLSTSQDIKDQFNKLITTNSVNYSSWHCFSFKAA